MAHPFHDFQAFHLENKFHLAKAIESYSTLLAINVISYSTEICLITTCSERYVLHRHSKAIIN